MLLNNLNRMFYLCGLSRICILYNLHSYFQMMQHTVYIVSQIIMEQEHDHMINQVKSIPIEPHNGYEIDSKYMIFCKNESHISVQTGVCTLWN